LKIQRRAADRGRGLCFLFFSLLLVGCATGCVGGHSLVRRDRPDAAVGAGTPAIAWFSPAVTADTAVLARWRSAVGPPVLNTPPMVEPASDAITVVSWNTALGAADVAGLVNTLPDPGAPLVLLLQEVYRGGPEVPNERRPGLSFAGQHGGAAAGARRQEVEAIAAALGLGVYYVPSMRNGPPSRSDEDRGNAILSNLALGDLTAVELPFEKQRRVAIAASVAGHTTTGIPWRLRVVNAHLDNIGGARRGWVAAELGRARQARGLTELLADGDPTILAGDFNTWFGFSDRAYVETARAFPDPGMVDRRRTFRGLLRLDHVFLRLAPGWHAEFRRGSGRFGSDHYPLVGTVRFR
jgi:endonuclease/exonuclease/phosphatase family metal-dependent hydrolase